MSRKLISCLCSIALIFAMVPIVLSGCSEWSRDTVRTTDNNQIKIGVSIWSTTDALGSACKKILDQTAGALGVKVQYANHSNSSEKVVASVEQLCAADCDGIIICNSSDTELFSAIKTCNDNEVYLAQFFRSINAEANPEVYQYALDSPYYVGCVHEDEILNGKTLATTLVNAGCRDIGLVGWEQGDATWLNRWAGYQKDIEEWNAAHPNDKAKLSEPQYAGTTSDGGRKAADAILNADTKIDAIIAAGGGGEPLEGVLSAIESMGKQGKIKVASTDFRTDLAERLANGSMYTQSGGHFCDSMFAFMLVYNAIKGNYVANEEKPNEIIYPYVYVSSPADYALYDKYFVQRDVYTDQELVEISNLSLDDLIKKATTVTPKDAEQRALAQKTN